MGRIQDRSRLAGAPLSTITAREENKRCSRLPKSVFEHVSDFLEVGHGVFEVAAKGSRSLAVPLAFQQIKNLQVLLALQAIAHPVDHGAVGEQAAHAVDPAHGLQEERI